MAELVIANPIAERTIRPIELAPRPGDLAGKTIGLYWNIKAGGDIALDEVEVVLGSRFARARFVRLIGSVGSTVRHVTPRDADEIAASCDAVVGTTGD